MPLFTGTSIGNSGPTWVKGITFSGHGATNTYVSNLKTYRYVQWNANATSGLVIPSDGFIEVLIVGAGYAGGNAVANFYGAGAHASGNGGDGGNIYSGIILLSSGTYSITVATVSGNASSIGSISSSIGAIRATGPGRVGMENPGVNGNAGLTSTITGSSVVYGGSGGSGGCGNDAGAFRAGSTGGLGGGGAGGTGGGFGGGSDGSPGQTNTGGGGGGAGFSGVTYWPPGFARSGGAGGSGVVIVRTQI